MTLLGLQGRFLIADKGAKERLDARLDELLSHGKEVEIILVENISTCVVVPV